MKIRPLRHAKNKMRWLRLSRADVEEILRNPIAETPSIKGRINAWKALRGQWYRVTYIVERGVVVVISVTDRRRGPRGGTQ